MGFFSHREGLDRGLVTRHEGGGEKNKNGNTGLLLGGRGGGL